jgi:hypothetical protein
MTPGGFRFGCRRAVRHSGLQRQTATAFEISAMRCLRRRQSKRPVGRAVPVRTLVIGLLAFLPAASRAGDDRLPATSQPATRLTRTQPAPSWTIDAAIRALGDPRWSVRRDAAHAILDYDTRALVPLRDAFGASRNHERRLRIRELALMVFSRRYTADRPGFLGIRQRPIRRREDPRIPEGTSWVLVQDVFQDTAADRAGFRPGDRIVRLNGQTIRDDPIGFAFIQMLADYRPGDTVALDVKRGDAPPQTVRVRIGHRPPWVLAISDTPDDRVRYEEIVGRFDAWWRHGGPLPEPSRTPAAGRATTRQATTRPDAD